MRDQPFPLDETAGHPDYFVDMIEGLAQQARALGEVEVGLHLEAMAKARRHKLDRDEANNPMLKMSL